MVSDPVNYWPMDEGSGSILRDVAGGATYNAGHNGLWIPGKIGYGLRTDGVTTFASYAQVNLGSVHSICFWVRWQESGDGVLIGGPNGYYAPYIDGPNAGDTIYYSAGIGNFTGTVHGGISSTAWTHFVITRGNDVIQFYKNGVKIGSSQFISSGSTTQFLTRFCQYETGTPFYAQADLDEVRFYSRELTPADIAELYSLSNDVPDIAMPLMIA